MAAPVTNSRFPVSQGGHGTFYSIKNVTIATAAAIMLLALLLWIDKPSPQTVRPRENAETKISLGVLPDKRMMLAFKFPPISEAEVNALRKDIEASIIPEGFGSVSPYEAEDISPDGEEHSYAMFEVSTKAVRPHYLKLRFLNPDRWPKEVTVTVNGIGL